MLSNSYLDHTWKTDHKLASCVARFVKTKAKAYLVVESISVLILFIDKLVHFEDTLLSRCTNCIGEKLVVREFLNDPCCENSKDG
jgi:hypothetical protein